MMKKTIALLLSMVGVTIFAHAQVAENQVFMSLGTKNALTLTLPTTDQKAAEKAWTKFVKPYGKTKENKKTGEFFTDNANISGISANTVDVYAKFQSGQIVAWFDLGGAFLSSAEHPDAYPVGEKLLLSFALDLKKQLVAEELENEEKNLKQAEAELQRLEKERQLLEKSIADWKQRITEAEAKIQTNLVQQQQAQTKIEEQRALGEQIKTRLAQLGNE